MSHITSRYPSRSVQRLDCVQKWRRHNCHHDMCGIQQQQTDRHPGLAHVVWMSATSVSSRHFALAMHLCNVFACCCVAVMLWSYGITFLTRFLVYRSDKKGSSGITQRLMVFKVTIGGSVWCKQGRWICHDLSKDLIMGSFCVLLSLLVWESEAFLGFN